MVFLESYKERLCEVDCIAGAGLGVLRQDRVRQDASRDRAGHEDD